MNQQQAAIQRLRVYGMAAGTAFYEPSRAASPVVCEGDFPSRNRECDQRNSRSQQGQPAGPSPLTHHAASNLQNRPREFPVTPRFPENGGSAALQLVEEFAAVTSPMHPRIGAPQGRQGMRVAPRQRDLAMVRGEDFGVAVGDW